VETDEENTESDIADDDSDNESDNLSVATDSSDDSKHVFRMMSIVFYPKMENTTGLTLYPKRE